MANLGRLVFCFIGGVIQAILRKKSFLKEQKNGFLPSLDTLGVQGTILFFCATARSHVYQGFVDIDSVFLRSIHIKEKRSFCGMNLSVGKNSKQQRGAFILIVCILAEKGQSCKIENLEIIADTGEILIDRGRDGREKPWRRHKGNAMKLAEMYQLALELDDTCITTKRLRALHECASYLIFAIGADGEKKLKGANFCRLRTCPLCNWRKSLKLFGQVSQIVDLVVKEKKSARFIFTTFTIKNCTGDELSSNLDLLNRAFSYLTGKSRNFAPSAHFKRYLEGYMKAIEVTYNCEQGTYHPHVHCIFALKASYFRGQGYIRQDKWVELWKQCAKLDYDPIVDVRAIKGNTSGAIAELAKYPVKMDEVAEIGEKAIPALITFSHVLKKRRLITFGGVMADAKRRLALDDVEDGDLIHVEGEVKELNAVAMALYKWRVGVGAYIC